MTAKSQAVIITYSSKTYNKQILKLLLLRHTILIGLVLTGADWSLMVETDSSPPITTHFGGPGRAIGRECTCVRLCVWTITFEANVL